MDSERGSAPVDVVFAILFLLLLALGVMQVALSLYGRNTLISATHESARTAVELGRSEDEIEAIAAKHAREAAGGLIKDMSIEATVSADGPRTSVTVSVQAQVHAFGPLPVSVPVRTQAVAHIDEVVFNED